MHIDDNLDNHETKINKNISRNLENFINNTN